MVYYKKIGVEYGLTTELFIVVIVGASQEEEFSSEKRLLATVQLRAGVRRSSSRVLQYKRDEIFSPVPRASFSSIVLYI